MYCCILLLWMTENCQIQLVFYNVYCSCNTHPACCHSLALFCLWSSGMSHIHIYDIGFLWSYRNLQVLLLSVVKLYWFKVTSKLCFTILQYRTISWILILQSSVIWCHVLTLYAACNIFHVILYLPTDNAHYFWNSEDHALWYILIIKPMRSTIFSNLFLE